MPKRYKVQEIIRMIEKKGWVLTRSKGSHYIYKHPDIDRPLVVPFHGGILPPGTASAILRQAGVK